MLSRFVAAKAGILVHIAISNYLAKMVHLSLSKFLSCTVNVYIAPVYVKILDAIQHELSAKPKVKLNRRHD